MKQTTKILILILCLLVLISSVSAIYYPSGLGSLANFPANIILQDGFQVNATDIVARGNFIGNGSLITNILASSVQDVWVNESGDTMSGPLQINNNLSVNNSVLIGSGTEWLSIFSSGSIGYINSTNPLAITNNISVKNITAGEWQATSILDTYLASLNASKLLNIAYLTNLITLDWTNISNRPTHLLNFTDDINYSAKNVNSSDYWDGFDTAADLNLENHTFAEISANIGNWSADSSSYYVSTIIDTLGNFSAWDKSYGDLINVPTHLTNFTNDLNLENHTFAEISANIGNWSADSSNYYTSLQVDTLGNWSADSSSYYTSAVVDTLGNWSADSSNYYLATVIDTLGNWSAEKASYALLSYVQSLGNFSAWDKSYADLLYVPTHLTNFTYDLSLENHTFAEISANIGNWSADSSSYYTSAIVDTLGNWSADKATGFSGECANASSITVLNGLITNCT